MNTFFKAEDVISVYTREQAIKDGVLVDITNTAKEAGIRFPVAITINAWNKCVAVPIGLEGRQDEDGRLWDVIWMLKVAINNAGKTDRIYYKLLVVGKDKRQHMTTLKAVVGPGDNYEPVITIMLPDED